MPRGRLIQTFSLRSCVGPLADELSLMQKEQGPIFVDFVQGIDGMPFIVERDRSDNWLLVTNSRQDGETIVFQTIEQAKGGRFREYRIAGHGSKPGQMLISTAHTNPQGTMHWFTATTKGVTSTCKLLPVNPLTGAPLSTYEETTKLNRAGPGWGFNGNSFQIGDYVFIDMGGRSVLTRVVQSSGTAYFVQLIHDPGDTGRWIEPSIITGRLQ